MKKCKACSSFADERAPFCPVCGKVFPKYSPFAIIENCLKGVLSVVFFVFVQVATSIVYTTTLTSHLYASRDGEITPQEVLSAAVSHTSYISLISCVLTLLGVFIFLYRKKKKSLAKESSLLGTKPFAVWTAVVLLIIGIALNFAVSVGSVFIPIPESIVSSYEETYSFMGAGNFAAEFLSVAIFAPIVEELIFRGLCYGYFKKAMPKWLALLLSSAIFGAVHGNLLSFVFTGVIGLVLALFYEKTGSIAVPVLLHLGFNSGSYVLRLAPSQDDPLFYLVLLASALSLVFVGSVLFFHANQDRSENTLSDSHFGEENIYFENSDNDSDKTEI